MRGHPHRALQQQIMTALMEVLDIVAIPIVILIGIAAAVFLRRRRN
jgi:hypothetical protein